MRTLLAIFFLTGSAAVANDPPVMSIPVSHFRGAAHICPIGDNEALTARHVATIQVSSDPRDLAVSPLRFGKDGIAAANNWSKILDIAHLQTDRKLPYYFPIAKESAKVDDKVTITGYNNDKGYLQENKEAKVLNIQAGLLIYNSTPGPGSSGSCVFNEKNEVVGVNFAFYDGFKTIGLGVNLTPELLEKLRQ